MVSRAGFSKGETDGVLSANSVDSVLRNYFLGKGFAKTETDFFEIRRGFGLGFNIVSIISLLVFVRDYGDHPRHSPRTFPLGLLAPRCLGLALLLAFARLRAGGSGAMLFGGRKESFPQLRLVSAGLDQPAQPTPFLVFISAVCGVAFASDFCIAR